jgi:teichuronic acid biosynthesis glycosyltransferase TuaC
MRVLVVSNMWPDEASPTRGLFVREQYESLMALGLEVEILHFDGRAQKQNYLKLIPALKKRIKEFQPQLVHAHYGLTGAMCACLPRMPLVVTYHGSDVFTPWQKRFSRFAALRAKANIFVSEPLMRAMGAERSHVIPCGVDTHFFRPMDSIESRKKLGLPLDKRIVLFPADRSNLVKDFDLFQRAIDRIQGHEIHICELSGIKREHVPYLMNAADVMVLTSKYEGYCLAVTEAVACGLPVVAVPVANLARRLASVDLCRMVSRDASEIAAATTEVLGQQKRIEPIPSLAGLSMEDSAMAIRVLYEQIAGI